MQASLVRSFSFRSSGRNKERPSSMVLLPRLFLRPSRSGSVSSSIEYEISKNMLKVIPVELWTNVFSRLPPCDICSVTLTCRLFRHVGQPLLFHTLVIHPYISTNTSKGLRQKMGSHEARTKERLLFFQSPRIAAGITACHIVPTTMPARQIDYLVDATFDALSSFLHLTSLVCQSIHFSTKHLVALQKVRITNITLISCSTNVRAAPNFLQIPFQSVKLEDTTDSHFIAMFINSPRLQYLSGSPSRELLAAMKRVHPFLSLLELDIPMGCIRDPEFTEILYGCKALEALTIRASRGGQKPPLLLSSYEVSHQMLPRLSSYRGPNEYVQFFTTCSPLRLLDITGTHDPEILTLTFTGLSCRTKEQIKSLTFSTSNMCSSLLQAIHDSFPNLLTLTMRGPYLSPSAWPWIFAATGTHTSLRSLAFSVAVSDPNNFWKPPYYQIGDTLTCFVMLYPLLLRMYPSLRRCTLIYSKDGASLLWRQGSVVTEHPCPDDMRIEVDAFNYKSEGRTLYIDEVKHLKTASRSYYEEA